MNTIIEKIRAEVLRLIRKSPGPGSQYGFGMMSACNRILNFLDTIQEQPVCEGLEEEIYNYANTIAEGTPLFEIIPQTARHFYELGCRRTAEKYDEIEYKRQRADVCEGFSKDGIERAAFIRENAAEFMSSLLNNIQVVSPEDMQALADECVKTAEYIWEHSKRVTR